MAPYSSQDAGDDVTRPTWRRLLLGASLTAILSIAAVLFLTPPPPLLRALAGTFPVALMTDSNDGAVAPRIARRSLQLYVRSALASYVADRSIPGGRSDSEVLIGIMAAVREMVLSVTQVPHIAKTWSTLVSGFGSCDQINGSVARVASHHFRLVQIYALYDAPRRMSPHTIGRVWSDQRRDWLYFDAFFDVPVVFTKQEDGSPSVLSTGAASESRGKAPPGTYHLNGWVMNEYRPSVGGQIAVKVAHRLGLGHIEAAPPTKATDQVLPDLPYDQSVFERTARAYAAARLDHLFRTPNRAAYRAIADDDATARDARADEFARAARVFATAP